MSRFQIHPERKIACKYNKPLYKTQYSEVLVKYEQGFDINTGKLIIHPHATHYSTSDEKSATNSQKVTHLYTPLSF